MSDQGGRKNRLLRLVPLILALFALAWTLGSLPRSQPGGTWLVNSYWILYIIVLLPVIALGVLVVGVIVLAYYWKAASEALGEGMAGRRMSRRRGGSKKAKLIAYGLMTALAIFVILSKCHGLGCNSAPDPNLVSNIVNDPGGPPSSLTSSLGGLSGLVGPFFNSDLYSGALLGLLLIGGAIMVRAFKVSIDQSKKYGSIGDQTESLVASEGLVAVQDALRIIREEDVGGPRERIVACYERMVRAASSMGARVTPDLTARELERSIRNTFLLRGEGIATLTDLFEEARYSLHSITQADSEVAHSCLLSIEEELHLNS